MSLFKIIRSQEWWNYKLPPLLTIGYATALMSGTEVYKVALWLLFLLFALIIGAIYVSTINDITDLEEDLASGKTNRMQQVPRRFRWVVPFICLVLGFIFGYFIFPDILSCGLYLLSWVSFSLYSIHPFRLKDRGIMGVFADACGSHVFPSLLMISSISYITKQPMNWPWFIAVGLWALCYGIRGILWHQFTDRENDIKVNLNTYASNIQPDQFRRKAFLIFSVELISLLFMFNEIHSLSPLVGLLFYLILVLIRYYRYNNKIAIIIQGDSSTFQIVMADYYQMFFPLSILVVSSAVNYFNLSVLIIHVFTFPYLLKLALQDYFLFVKSLLAKIRDANR